MEDLKQKILDKMFYLDMKDRWTIEDERKYEALVKQLKKLENEEIEN